VRETSANFETTMESDLALLWPAFAQARQDVAGELGIKADKKPRVYRDAVARAGEPPTFLLDVLAETPHGEPASEGSRGWVANPGVGWHNPEGGGA
jgi:hypothetical protein